MLQWVSHALAALVIGLTIIQIIWQHRLAHVVTDCRTKRRKKLATSLLGVAIAVVVTNQIVGLFDSRQKEEKAQKLESKIDLLNSNQAALKQNFENERRGLINQISLVNSNQLKLSGQNTALLNALSTNKIIEASTRLAILDVNRQFEILSSNVLDLNAWQLELDRKLTARKIQNQISEERQKREMSEYERILLEKSRPVLDYPVRRLQAMLMEVAEQTKDSILSSYLVIPDTFPENPNIAFVNLKRDTNWAFEVDLKRGYISDQHKIALLEISSLTDSKIVLSITSELHTQRYRTNETMIAAMHVDLNIPGEEKISSSVSGANYELVVDEYLRNLFAARASQISKSRP